MSILITKEESFNIVKKPYNKIYLWVGAGISYNSPTNFPLGNTLCKLLLKYALEDDCDTYLNRFKKVSKSLKIPNCEFPRLESIFQIIKEIDENLASKALNIVDIFSREEYNVNHSMLAKCNNIGVEIFTSNFDKCIEVAYRDLFDSDANVSHFHGTYEKRKNIGISIDNVTNLDFVFEKKLVKSLSTNALHIFLGYSISDDLDINYFFSSWNKDKLADAIYVSHKNTGAKRLSIQKRELLLSCFSNVYDVCIDTTEFISEAFGFTYEAKDNEDEYSFNDEFFKMINEYEFDKDAFKILLFEYLGVYVDNINLNNIRKHEFVYKYVDRIERKRTVQYNEEQFTEKMIVLNDWKQLKGDDYNRLSWEFYKKFVRSTFVEMDYLNLKKMQKYIDIYIANNNLKFKELITITRNRGIISVLLKDFKTGISYLKNAEEMYTKITNLDGILCVYIDYFLADLIISEYEGINDYFDIYEYECIIKQLTDEGEVLSKNNENYNFFKNKI